MSQKIGSLIGLLAFLNACGGEDGSTRAPVREPGNDSAETPAVPNTPGPSPAGPDAPTGTQSDSSAPWTAGSTTYRAPDQTVTTLRAVRTGSHPGFDRITFEFDHHVPNYHIEYIDRPVRSCGSGEVVPLAGDAWLEMRMDPANAHDEAGSATVADRNRILTLPIVKQLTLTCDFEAVVTWVAGVSTPAHYRVSRLASPARLVIDLQNIRS